MQADTKSFVNTGMKRRLDLDAVPADLNGHTLSGLDPAATPT
ncbi:MAG: hypothetical protein AAGA28_03135 [Pseudomonadota bacterium]